MSYADNYNLTQVYWVNYIDKYVDVYKHVYNEMSQLYEDQNALQAACATVMIAFSKAAGMDMAGVISWDEKLAGDTPDFKNFAEVKKGSAAPAASYQKPANSGYSGGSGSYQKPSGAPQQGGYAKKPYTSDKPLDGMISEAQLNAINKFKNSKNDEMRAIVEDGMAKAEVASVEELTKQQASNIIGACMKK